MIVLGLMGAIGSGKGTVGDILINDYGFKSITMGDMVREEVTSRGLEITREGTTKVSEECRKKDPLYFIKKVIEKIKTSGTDKWIIDGIRTPIDVKEFKKAFPSMKILLVEVDPKIRYERMLTRKRADMPKTYEEFLSQEKLEMEKFHLDETFKNSDYKVKNEGTMEELKEDVKKLVKKIMPEKKK